MKTKTRAKVADCIYSLLEDSALVNLSYAMIAEAVRERIPGAKTTAKTVAHYVTLHGLYGRHPLPRNRSVIAERAANETKQKPLIQAALENTTDPPTAFQLQLFEKDESVDWYFLKKTYYPISSLGVMDDPICCAECSDKESNHCPCSRMFYHYYDIFEVDIDDENREIASGNDKFHLF